MNQDIDQIKTLGICTLVYSGISALFAFFPIFHLLIGISMLNGSFYNGNPPTETGFPISIFALMFTILPAVMIFFGLAFAVALAISGYFLLKKRHYLYCMVMGAISCVFVPFGTVLGIFTIIVLQRPSVKELFHSIPS